MNIYDLARVYIDAIPEGDTDLNYDDIVNMITLQTGKELTIRYRGYQGLMAREDNFNTVDKKPKLGYFDFFIDLGEVYEGNGLTHRDLIQGVIDYSNIDNCMRIWMGEDIEEVAKDEMEEIVLSALALCMLEQEINWGTRSWQKFTHFRNRGRDMIMGFIVHAFDRGINHIPHWNWNRTTPTFGGSFSRYDYPQYFTFEENPQSILSGDILSEFNRKIRMKNNHPNWYEKQA